MLPSNPTCVSNLQEQKLAVLQPGYLPWLGFFDQLHRADVFIVYDDVLYDKHGWRNRNRVKSPQGPHWLTVPVKVKGKEKPLIKEVEIDHRLPWARKHVGTLRQFYKKSPFMQEYIAILEGILQHPWEKLIELDLALIRQFCEWLDIHPPTCCSSELEISGSQSGRLVSLCKHYKATTYLSGNAAQDYLDVTLFSQEGIAVEWQNYQHPIYSQLYGSFAPHLSIVDLLFNCGPESGFILKSNPNSQ